MYLSVAINEKDSEASRRPINEKSTLIVVRLHVRLTLHIMFLQRSVRKLARVETLNLNEKAIQGRVCIIDNTIRHRVNLVDGFSQRIDHLKGCSVIGCSRVSVQLYLLNIEEHLKALSHARLHHLQITQPTTQWGPDVCS